MGTTTAAETTTANSKNEDGDRLTHTIHRCGVEPILTRCGARPRPGYVPGQSLPPNPKAILCKVCEELQNYPCERCEKRKDGDSC